MGPLYNAHSMGQWQLTENDLGKWLCFEWHFSPDQGDSSGAIEFWVNGEKQYGTKGISVGNAPPARDFFKAGYLMGWANSGFEENTYIFIDDVVMADSYIGPATDSPQQEDQGELPAPDDISVSSE
jgi:hypothetical protein